MRKVLVVDDDVTFNLMLKTFLQKQEYEVQQAYSFADAQKSLSGFKPDIVLTDMRLPEKDGIELLKEIKKMAGDVPVILMTGYADIRTAVTAMKYGAFDYISKPLNPEDLLELMKWALKAESRGVVRAPQFTDFIEGNSKLARKISEHAELVAPTPMSVLIMGESGTGKEFVARKIHQLSNRHSKPFMAIDCGALPRDLAASEFFGHLKGSFTGAISDKIGQFEAANGGTLFLDEVGNLSYDVQVQLLRAIQERKIRRIGSNNEIRIDVRIISATNEDLKQKVQRGEFREDLYHRINEFGIHIAALRERPDDMLQFAGHFLAEANQELERNVERFSPEVLELFTRYPWPGNLRELKNVIKRTVLLSNSKEVKAETLPDEFNRLDEFSLPHMSGPEPEDDGDISLKGTAQRSEKDLIITTLQKVRFNKSKAAHLLNIDRKTLYNKMKQYDIPL